MLNKETQRSLGALAQTILVPRTISIKPKLIQKLLMARYVVVLKEKVSRHHLLLDLPKLQFMKIKTTPQKIPTTHVGTEEVDLYTVHPDHPNLDREEFFHFGADAVVANSETS